jgi:hypothetical protein
LNRTCREGSRRDNRPGRIGLKRAGRTAVAVGIVIALLIAGVTDGALSRDARASDIVVDTSSSLSVTATNTYSFQPNVIDDMPTNVTITVNFTNGALGTIHTFTIIGCENVSIPSGADPSTYINGSKCASPPLVNIVPSAPPSSKTLTFQSRAKVGWFEFVCTVSGHFSLGMFGFIAFGMAVPSNLSLGSPNTGPGLAVFIIIGTIVTLTVIAIVLGFVVGRREGSRHEMPPERLGYAEPGPPAGGKPPATPPAT